MKLDFATGIFCDDDAPEGALDLYDALRPTCSRCDAYPQWRDVISESNYCDAHKPHDVRYGMDLRGLIYGEIPDQDWLVEPLIPVNKHVGLVARRGDGKSLLALELATKVAAGEKFLHREAGNPLRVLYLDQEMGQDDLRERLVDLGWKDHPLLDTMLDNLFYYQMIDLPPFDTEEGGAALLRKVEELQVELVVIDTLSRVVSGAENDNDTYKSLFRHTESHLKKMGVALLRLDHFGKDNTRGSRGASGKEDGVDVVWELLPEGPYLKLRSTKGRQGNVPEFLYLQREDGPLRHIFPDKKVPQDIVDKAGFLDALSHPIESTVRETANILRSNGLKVTQATVAEIVRFRKAKASRRKS